MLAEPQTITSFMYCYATLVLSNLAIEPIWQKDIELRETSMVWLQWMGQDNCYMGKLLELKTYQNLPKPINSDRDNFLFSSIETKLLLRKTTIIECYCSDIWPQLYFPTNTGNERSLKVNGKSEYHFLFNICDYCRKNTFNVKGRNFCNVLTLWRNILGVPHQ